MERAARGRRQGVAVGAVVAAALVASTAGVVVAGRGGGPDAPVAAAEVTASASPSPSTAVVADGPSEAGPAADAATPFYVDPTTQAAAAAAGATGPERDAALRIAAVPQALWLVDPDPATAGSQVRDYTARADAAGRTGVVVVYGVPGRDCGSHSAGGVAEQAYRDWVAAVADGLVGEPWVVLEPDALAQLGDCDGQGDRVGMLRDAARALDDAGARVYLDAGHAAWLPADEVAGRVRAVGLEHLAGFALNVSNYRTTSESRAYGDAVSALLEGLPYVVDTSRNGAGPGDGWCNPPGRLLGEEPRLGDGALAALLWVKHPGESDGTCGGGPPAGQWWPQAARDLVGAPG
jgi:endoglucanase